VKGYYKRGHLKIIGRKKDMFMPDPDGEPESGLLPVAFPLARWVGPAFVLCSLVLIPWTIYLGLTLPSRQLSRHYNVAWVGFDVLLLVALGATGYFAIRQSRYLAVSSAAAAALLVVDAWFDIMTSPRRQLPQAIVLAVLVELPLAAVCAWLSYHTENLAARRIILLQRRRRPGPLGAVIRQRDPGQRAVWPDAHAYCPGACRRCRQYQQVRVSP
jgi:hypothetical protein